MHDDCSLYFLLHICKVTLKVYAHTHTYWKCRFKSTQNTFAMISYVYHFVSISLSFLLSFIYSYFSMYRNAKRIGIQITIQCTLSQNTLTPAHHKKIAKYLRKLIKMRRQKIDIQIKYMCINWCWCYCWCECDCAKDSQIINHRAHHAFSGPQPPPQYNTMHMKNE